MATSWPRALTPVNGPMRADKLAGAAVGMGDWGAQSQALAAQGWVPADMLTGLTLFILSQQPRDPGKQQAIPGGGGGVAGGVWVRERFAIYQPLASDDKFTVQGEAVGRHVHKGRRYGTNRCSTRNAAGQPVATNLTTGLLAYKVQEGLSDGIEGVAPDSLDAPAPDWTHAGLNPCLAAIDTLQVGEQLGGYEVLLGLDLMAARDTKKPDNPIHSDPELARKAGLSQPIAGGSHVLAFALEVILQRLGPMALFYGASFDIRWKAPVYADAIMVPRARVMALQDDRVVFEVDAMLADDVTAMAGQVVIPRPSASGPSA